MTVEIRRARDADAGALAALAERAIPGAWSRESILSELGREIAEVRVAEEGGALLGFSISWRVAGEVELLLIAVDPEARRRGIGTALLAALEEDAAAVHLEVRARNAGARALYQARGYAVTGVRRGYYTDDGDDAVLMSKHR